MRKHKTYYGNIKNLLVINIIVYTVGYGVLLYVIIKIEVFKVGKKVEVDYSYEPEVTLFIAAYNEKDYVAEK
jgi:hypothetical protein